MEIWQAIILGAVQGFAEFLPISSSGHLLLIENWFGIKENALFYGIMLHIGTLIPVIFVLWKDIIKLFSDKCKGLLYLVIATIPAGIVGVVFSKVIDIDAFFANNIWVLSIAFLVTAAMMFFTEIRAKRSEETGVICVRNALFMGCGQAFGVVPGISRSGSTIAGGTLAKVNKNDKASFTFLMSIPIILAAALLEGVKVVKEGAGSVSVLPLAIGVLTACICGYIAVKFMLKLIKKSNFKWFSLYLVVISVINLVVYLV